MVDLMSPSPSPGIPDCLRADHAHYAPKLAAAVRAWQALANERIQSKSPKKRLIAWLTSRAQELALTTADGKPIKSAIEEIAKVANWKPKGGAPKTGGT
jgi:hypothetical protein